MRRDEVGKNHPTTGFGSGPLLCSKQATDKSRKTEARASDFTGDVNYRM